MQDYYIAKTKVLFISAHILFFSILKILIACCIYNLELRNNIVDSYLLFFCLYPKSTRVVCNGITIIPIHSLQMFHYNSQESIFNNLNKFLFKKKHLVVINQDVVLPLDARLL